MPNEITSLLTQSVSKGPGSGNLPKSSLDLTSLLGSINSANATEQRLGAQEQSLIGEQQAMYNNAASTQERIGAADVIIQQAKDISSLAIQAANQETASIIGTNPKDAGFRARDLMQEHDTYKAQADKLAPQILQDKSIDLTDDPLGWVAAQFRLMGTEEAYDFANKKSTAALAEIQNLNLATQSQITTNKLLDTSLTQASMSAGLDKLRDQASLLATQERLKASATGLEGLKLAMNVNKDVLSNKIAAFTASKQEESNRIALAHLDMERDKYLLALRAKKIDDEAEGSIIKAYNEGVKTRLGPQAATIEPGTGEAKKIVQLILSGSEAGKMFSQDFQAGQQKLATGLNMLAASPAKSMDVIASMPVNLSPAQQTISNSLLGAVAEEVRGIAAQGYYMDAKGERIVVDKKDKKGIEDLYNRKVYEKLDAMAKNVVVGDKDNVFNIGSLTGIIATNDSLKTLPVVQKVLAPAIQKGVNVNDPETVFGLLIAGVKSGDISYNDALKVNQVYQVGANNNLAARNFRYFGIEPKITYQTKVNTDPGSPWRRAQSVEWTDAQSIGRALNRAASNIALQPKNQKGLDDVLSGAVGAVGSALDTLIKNSPDYMAP